MTHPEPCKVLLDVCKRHLFAGVKTGAIWCYFWGEWYIYRYIHTKQDRDVCKDVCMYDDLLGLKRGIPKIWSIIDAQKSMIHHVMDHVFWGVETGAPKYDRSCHIAPALHPRKICLIVWSIIIYVCTYVGWSYVCMYVRTAGRGSP